MICTQGHELVFDPVSRIWVHPPDPFGFADAIQVDHLTDEQVEQVAAIFDKADE